MGCHTTDTSHDWSLATTDIVFLTPVGPFGVEPAAIAPSPMFVVSQALTRSARRRMADREQIDALRDASCAGAQRETVERLLGYASQPEGSRQDVHSLYHEIMDAWPADLFTRDFADGAVRVLWDVYLPEIAAPRHSSIRQPPASPRSDPE